MALWNKKADQRTEYAGMRGARKNARENARAVRQLERRQNRTNVPPDEYQTAMEDTKNIAEISNLRTWFYTDAGVIKAVDDVSFNIAQGTLVGIVGESGCGKSVLCLSLMRLLQRPQGQLVSGEIRFQSKQAAYDIANMPEEAMQQLRGNDIAMIFQEPMTSLNPVLRIGLQIDEAVSQHQPSWTREQVRARTLELLSLVEIPDTESVCRMYPHALSGGMRQRVMIAIALSCDPRLIIADEPTTALDVTIQAQILELLNHLKNRINASILLITHDLGVIAGMADTMVVMYAGRIVEKGTTEEVFLHPAHPYTIGLMQARPVPGGRQERLYSIPGAVPSPIDLPDCCFFRDRCACQTGRCGGAYPAEIALTKTHFVSCYRAAKEEADA